MDVTVYNYVTIKYVESYIKEIDSCFPAINKVIKLIKVKGMCKKRERSHISANICCRNEAKKQEIRKTSRLKTDKQYFFFAHHLHVLKKKLCIPFRRSLA